MSELQAENDQLVRSLIRGMGSVVVAYSGGVDSSVVLALARQELGPDSVLAVTASSETYPEEELESARRTAQLLGVRHEVIETRELEKPEFRANPPERCYHCKAELFRQLWDLARRERFAVVADGANKDDKRDFRPGITAADEMGVRHPLMEAGLGKEAVRSLALRLGLDVWDKPAMPCLSSRFPYGEEITLSKIEAVRRAERFLRDLDFGELRVRHHGDVARLELHPDDMDRMADGELRRQVAGQLKRLGFTYVALDLEGFRSGSLNEVLSREEGTDHGG